MAAIGLVYALKNTDPSSVLLLVHTTQRPEIVPNEDAHHYRPSEERKRCNTNQVPESVIFAALAFQGNSPE